MVDAMDGMRPGGAGGDVAGLPLGGPSRGVGGDGGFALQFSKHATKRIEQRGLDIDGAQMVRLERAVGQAEAKGSRDSLILLDDLALVVSVQHRLVVTAMDEESSKEHVFTNIDSVVIAP
jgi:flagellar operon protein